MNELQDKNIQCPYCGELIEIAIDCSEHQQNYIEDCSVCCHPINITVEIDLNQQVYVQATHENE